MKKIVNDILSKDVDEISEMNFKELNQTYKALREEANKRLSQAIGNKKGIFSPALRFQAEQLGVEENLSKITNLQKAKSQLQHTKYKRNKKGLGVKRIESQIKKINLEIKKLSPKLKSSTKMNKKKLKAEILNAREFLSRKTSTQKGFNEYREKVKELLPSKAKIFGDKDKENEFWRGYTKFVKNTNVLSQQWSSDELIAWLDEMVDGATDIQEDVIFELLNMELEDDSINEEDKFREFISVDREDVSVG